MLKKCRDIIKRDPLAIIGLQETHFVESDIKALEYKWRQGLVYSNGTSHQCGVLLLFGSAGKIITKYWDIQGRICTAVLEYNDKLYSFTNVYAPCDSNISYFELLYKMSN